VPNKENPLPAHADRGFVIPKAPLRRACNGYDQYDEGDYDLVHGLNIAEGNGRGEEWQMGKRDYWSEMKPQFLGSMRANGPVCSSPFLRPPGLAARFRPHVFRRGPNDSIVLVLFHDVRGPTESAGRGKQGREVFLRNAQGQVDDAFVELHVGA
jgi:hypothetical protein